MSLRPFDQNIWTVYTKIAIIYELSSSFFVFEFPPLVLGAPSIDVRNFKKKNSFIPLTVLRDVSINVSFLIDGVTSERYRAVVVKIKD